MKAQAFFVVGHSNWGKSQTLRALAGPHQVRRWSVKGRDFFVRRMSNDDLSDKWMKFIKQLDPARRSHVIAALCPKTDALDLLGTLKDKYNLFFWVLRHSYEGYGAISAQEEDALRALGTVVVFDQKHAPAEQRAKALKEFVLANP